MPLIRIDVVKGRSEAEIKALLHAAHRAMLGPSGYRPATATRS